MRVLVLPFGATHMTSTALLLTALCFLKEKDDILPYIFFIHQKTPVSPRIK